MSVSKNNDNTFEILKRKEFGEEIIDIATTGKGYTEVSKDDPRYQDVVEYGRQALSSRRPAVIVNHATAKSNISYELKNKNDTRKRKYDTRTIPTDSVSYRLLDVANINEFTNSGNIVNGEVVVSTISEELVIYDEYGIPKIIRPSISQGVTNSPFKRNTLNFLKRYELTKEELEKLCASLELSKYNGGVEDTILPLIEKKVRVNNNIIFSFVVVVEITMEDVEWDTDADAMIEYELRSRKLVILKNIQGYHDTVRICSGSTDPDEIDGMRFVLVDNSKVFSKGVTIRALTKTLKIFPIENEFSENGLFIFRKSEILEKIEFSSFEECGIYREEEHLNLFEDEAINKKNVAIDKLERKLREKENEIVTIKSTVTKLKNDKIEAEVKNSPALKLLDFFKQMFTGYAGMLTAFSKLLVL